MGAGSCLCTVVPWSLAQDLAKYLGLCNYSVNKKQILKGIVREAQNQKPDIQGKFLSSNPEQ